MGNSKDKLEILLSLTVNWIDRPGRRFHGRDRCRSGRLSPGGIPRRRRGRRRNGRSGRPARRVPISPKTKGWRIAARAASSRNGLATRTPGLGCAVRSAAIRDRRGGDHRDLEAFENFDGSLAPATVVGELPCRSAPGPGRSALSIAPRGFGRRPAGVGGARRAWAGPRGLGRRPDGAAEGGARPGPRLPSSPIGIGRRSEFSPGRRKHESRPMGGLCKRSIV